MAVPTIPPMCGRYASFLPAEAMAEKAGAEIKISHHAEPVVGSASTKDRYRLAMHCTRLLRVLAAATKKHRPWEQ